LATVVVRARLRGVPARVSSAEPGGKMWFGPRVVSLMNEPASLAPRPRSACECYPSWPEPRACRTCVG